MDIALSQKYIDSLRLLEGGWPSKKKVLFDTSKVLFLLPGYDAKVRELSGGYVLYETPGGYSLLACCDSDTRTILDITKTGELPLIDSYKDAAIAASASVRELGMDFLPKHSDTLLSELINSSFSPSFCMLLDRLDQKVRDEIRGVAHKTFLQEQTIEKGKDESKHFVSQVIAKLGIQQKYDALARALAKLDDEDETQIGDSTLYVARALSKLEDDEELEIDGPIEIAKTETVLPTARLDIVKGYKPEIPSAVEEDFVPNIKRTKTKEKEFQPAPILPTPEKEAPAKPTPVIRRHDKIKVDPADLERAILASLAENYRQLLEKRKETAKTNKPLKHVTLAAREDVIANNDIDEILKILDRRIRKNGLKSSGERWLILLATTVDERTADIIDRHYPGKVYYTDEPEKGRPDFAFIVKPNKNPEAEKEEEISLVKDKRASFDAPVEKNAYDQDFVDEFGYYPFDEEEEIQEEEEFESNPNLPYEEGEPAYPKIWRCYLCGNKKTHTGTPAKVIRLSNGKTAYVCQKHKNKI